METVKKLNIEINNKEYDLSQNLSLRNDFIYFSWDPARKDVCIRDLIDQYNEPTAYNKTKRGIKKALIEFLHKWDGSMNFSSASEIFSQNNICMHHYCAVD